MLLRVVWFVAPLFAPVDGACEADSLLREAAPLVVRLERLPRAGYVWEFARARVVEPGGRDSFDLPEDGDGWQAWTVDAAGNVSRCPKLWGTVVGDSGTVVAVPALPYVVPQTKPGPPRSFDVMGRRVQDGARTGIEFRKGRKPRRVVR